MTVTGLVLDASSRSPIVLLRDPSGHRQVPIWIDHAQAHNIVAGFKPTQTNKPLTHDIIVSLLKMGNLLLDRIIIHEIEGDTFQAVLKLSFKDATNEINQGGAKSNALMEIEALPSDAIALAVRTNCSIWMLEKVVAEASIPVDEEADEEDQDKFRQFLSDISPADLIRHLKKSDQINENPFNNSASDNKN